MKFFVAAILAAMFHGSWAADMYMGIKAGLSSLNGPVWQGQTDTYLDQSAMAVGHSPSFKSTEDTGKGVAGGIFMGVRDGAFAIEFAVSSLGSFDSTINSDYGVGKANLHVDMVELSGLYHSRFGLYGRAGVHRASVKTQAHTWTFPGEYVHEVSSVSTGPLVGVGYEYGPFFAEYTKYFNVGTVDTTGKHSINTFWIGVKENF